MDFQLASSLGGKIPLDEFHSDILCLIARYVPPNELRRVSKKMRDKVEKEWQRFRRSPSLLLCEKVRFVRRWFQTANRGGLFEPSDHLRMIYVSSHSEPGQGLYLFFLSGVCRCIYTMRGTPRMNTSKFDETMTQVVVKRMAKKHEEFTLVLPHVVEVLLERGLTMRECVVIALRQLSRELRTLGYSLRELVRGSIATTLVRGNPSLERLWWYLHHKSNGLNWVIDPQYVGDDARVLLMEIMGELIGLVD